MSDQHLNRLRDEYENCVKTVQETEPDSVARNKAMDAKAAAFKKWYNADQAAKKLEANPLK